MMALEPAPVIFGLNHLRAGGIPWLCSTSCLWRLGRKVPLLGTLRNQSWIHDFAGAEQEKPGEFFGRRIRLPPTAKLRPVRLRIRYFFRAQEQLEWFRCDEPRASGLGRRRGKRARAKRKRFERCPNNRPATGYFATR